MPADTAFWHHYLRQHSKAGTRAWHYAGTVAAAALALAALATASPTLALAVPVAGYGPAWVGHFIVEKNRPATFTYPLWSLMGDFKMWGSMLTGKLWSGVPVAPMTEEQAIAATAPTAC